MRRKGTSGAPMGGKKHWGEGVTVWIPPKQSMGAFNGMVLLLVTIPAKAGIQMCRKYDGIVHQGGSSIRPYRNKPGMADEEETPRPGVGWGGALTGYDKLLLTSPERLC
jgi:hypothetical protein